MTHFYVQQLISAVQGGRLFARFRDPDAFCHASPPCAYRVTLFRHSKGIRIDMADDTGGGQTLAYVDGSFRLSLQPLDAASSAKHGQQRQNCVDAIVKIWGEDN